MIVPSMNSEELLVEVYKDLEVVNRKANYLMQGLRRQAIKSRGKYIQRVYDYISLRHNNWFIIVDYDVKGYQKTMVAYYSGQYGLNGILVNGDKESLMIFTSHFLDRYNERFLRRNGVSHLELLKRFIPANSVQTIMLGQRINRNEEQIFVRLNEGVGLGYKEYLSRGKAIYHFKTFISNEMILEHQIDDFNDLGKLYDRYWEEMYSRGNRCA